MKYSKIDPIKADGNLRKGYETVHVVMDYSEYLEAFDIALAKYNLQLEVFKNTALNSDMFRVIPKA